MLDYNHTSSFAEVLNGVVDTALITENSNRPARDYLGGSRVGHPRAPSSCMSGGDSRKLPLGTISRPCADCAATLP
jgi:hypothetical protein